MSLSIEWNKPHILCCLWQPEPIYSLVPLDIPDANTRIANLKQATADYVAEYNVCKCKPCKNGGTLALLDGKCICLCPHLYEGLACQNFKPDKNPVSGKRQWCGVLIGQNTFQYNKVSYILSSSFCVVNMGKGTTSAAPATGADEGNWSCWSAWSDCTAGKRTRSRSCNTDGVSGLTCRGEDASEEFCWETSFHHTQTHKLSISHTQTTHTQTLH